MPEPLVIDRLVAATEARQIFRARRGDGEWTVVLLPKAPAAPPGWAGRLEALVAGAAKLRAAGAVPIEQAGMAEGIVALLRPWVAGQSGLLLEGMAPLLTLLAAVDLATGLQRLHAAGLFEGELGPDSVWVGAGGRLSLTEPGLGPALSGTAATEATDIQALGRTLYLWLTGRESTLDPLEPLPPDFGMPSRIDRRVPAPADALVLRALQAGGPRGIRSAEDLVGGLRQVLRVSGAAVSPGDVAAWVEKRAAMESSRPWLLKPGQRVELAPLAEKRPPAPRVADTLVDYVVPESARLALAPKPAAAPEPKADTLRELPRAAAMQRMAAAPAEPTETSQSASVSVSVMQRPKRRRALGGAAAAALVGGVVVLGYALGNGAGRSRRGKHAAPPAPLLPPVPALAAAPTPPPAPAQAPIPQAPPLPPLKMYDPNAPARPAPKKPAHERGEARLGRGAFLTLEANRVARVFVDGRDTQLLTPVKRLPIAPGAHRVRLVAALGSDGSQEFRIHVKRGATAYRYGNLGD